MFYTVYGITDCPSCLHAQALLMGYNVEYVFVNTDFSKTYRDQIKKQFFWPTFPIVVLNSEHKTEVIGGYEELQSHMVGRKK